MSDSNSKTCQTECSALRLKISEHMAAVGEEMVSVLLDKQQQQRLDVRAVVLERLSAAAEFLCQLFHREMETQRALLRRHNNLLELMLQPRVSLCRAGWLRLHSDQWFPN